MDELEGRGHGKEVMAHLNYNIEVADTSQVERGVLQGGC